MTSEPASVPPSWSPVGATCNTQYFLVGDDILIVYPNPGSVDDGASARENVAFQMGLAQKLGRPLGFVVVVSSLTSQDAEARRVYAAGMLPERSLGVALVVQNPLSRAIASFFLGLTKPKIPTKIVSSIEEGIASFEEVARPERWS